MEIGQGSERTLVAGSAAGSERTLAAGIAAGVERLIGLVRSLSPADGLSLTAAATLAPLERAGPRRATPAPPARRPGGRDAAGHDAADRAPAGRRAGPPGG